MELIDLIAYIDAGTGSMLLQAAAAGIFAAALFMKNIRNRLRALLTRHQPRE